MQLLDRKKLYKDGIVRHEKRDYTEMAKAGQVAAKILDDLCNQVEPGVRTIELEHFIDAKIKEYGVDSATKGYREYKHASCISVNQVVCHGIPGTKIPGKQSRKNIDTLISGDILNIDVTIIRNGWFGDSSRMYIAGKPSMKALHLIKVAHDALMIGLDTIRPGNTFGDLGWAIEQYAKRNRMGVVKDFCGHGIGRSFHAEPNVLHFGQPGTGRIFEEGMFFTVEPMINLGKPSTKILSDGWTAVTRDKSLSAQFEHTIGVTSTGIEIFTLSPENRFYPTNFQLRAKNSH